VSRWTGVPVTRLRGEIEKLPPNGDSLHRRVVGQDAKDPKLCANAVPAKQGGLSDPNGPDRVVPVFSGRQASQDRNSARALAEFLVLMTIVGSSVST